MAKVRQATDEERKARDYSIPAGRYVVGWAEFERKCAKNPPYNDYLRIKFCTVKNTKGENGRGFRDIFGLLIDTKDESKKKAAKFNLTRWQILIDILGINEEFELGETKEDTHKEGDRNICRLFVGRAFVVEVNRTESGAYTNNSIQKLVFRNQWTEQELAKVEAWEAAQKTKRSPEGEAPEGSDDIDRYDNEDDPFDGSGDDLDDDPMSWA